MPLHDAEALVLRQYSFAEADRIVVFLTREFGKLRGVAQGVKKPRSALGATLEPLNHIRLQFYLREGAELSRIRHCELIHSFLGKGPTLEQVYAYGYFAELAQEFVGDNQANDPLFRLMIAALTAGEKRGASPALVRYVELWSLRLSGLLPDYERCSGCRRSIRGEGFSARVESGEVTCDKCGGSGEIRVTAAASSVLRSALSMPPEQFAAQPLGEGEGRVVERLTQRLIEYHLEKRLKSYALLKQVL